MVARIDAAGLRMLALAAAFCAAIPAARGQSSSLYGDPQMRKGLTMNETSWIYESPADPKQFKLNDQITIVVSESSAVTSQGSMDRRKDASLDAILSKWILLNKFAVSPDPQTAGSPEIAAELQNKMQSQADLQTKDTMLFKIACRVADKRPNGLLVIEGHRTIRNNNETWEQCLSGVIRPQDVQPNNQVLSENVAELIISKREEGHVRDGYRRGWLLKVFDKYQPF
jgi:flagellar L-ring protein precursor FlgH